MTDRLTTATGVARTKAALRAGAVVRAQELLAGGRTRLQAESIAADEYGVSRGSVMRWLRAATVDPAGGRDPGMFVARNGGGRPSVAWDTPGAEEAWRIWTADYLRRERPGSAACWRRTAKIARQRGWTVPCERTFRLRLYREVPPEEIVRLREGRVAALQLYPAQRRTVDGMSPLDAVSGDGKVHDVFVAMPDGRVIRPRTWAWQDVRTRKILGWHTGETESQDLVRMAFVRMVDKHGVPRIVVVDNTFAASSKWWSSHNRRGWRSDGEDVPGILDQLGIRVIHTSVVREDDGKGRGWGQAKPVERFFGDLENIDRHPLCAGAYTGANPLAKPANYRSAAVPWDTFLGVVAEGVAEYNARPGRRMEAAAGRSIDETWAEEIASVPVRRLARSQRALLLLAVESTQVQRDGTFSLAAGKGTGLPANRYWHESLRRLIHLRRDRRRVVVRFDPAALHDGVEVYGFGGRWMCHAECQTPVGFADAAGAREHNRARRAMDRGLQQVARAQERIEDIYDELGMGLAAPAAAPAEEARPKVAELVIPERRRAAAAEAEREEREDRFVAGILRAINEN